MQLSRLFFNIFLVIFITSCSTTRYTNPVDYPDAVISFGNGGGFSGLVTEYSLLDNGQLLKKMATQDSFEIVKTIDKKLVKQIFNNYAFLKINEIDYQQPGNRYHFIKYKHHDQRQEIIWADGQVPDEQAKVFNEILIGLVKL